MKRSPMRRARKNRRRHQDNSIRWQYSAMFPEDEWEYELHFSPPQVIDDEDPRRWMPNEQNHIFTQPRRDLVPCLITLSKISHDWFHENILVGRMLCMLVKLRKGEADLEVWQKSYRKNVEWILDQPPCLEERYAAFRAECVQRLKELAGAE